MADHLDSVKGLAKQFRAWSQTVSDAGAASRHTQNANLLDAIIAELEQLRRITQPIPESYGDLSDLPPELLKELSGIKADDREQQLFTIIKSGDDVELDAILIELWRRFKVVESRKFLQNKLWRMAQKGMIWTVAGKKGVYTATKPEAIRVRPPPATFDTDLDDDVPF
ncbi:MAG: hypothetical protein H0W65_09135 [Sphingomonas sp.]|uniref:hypothetical protein n=1 Tax=Sphingomonas sp. TaxID=28214 RepID=UPI0017C3DC2A|nr:hypothetical protein [Sphingomonas sp.]MBA3667872.1 hypothetical protein [Sphingomonas sp.]